jgi:hypothetical protein
VLRIVGLICTAGACLGCVHDPADPICPTVGDGDLVVTEIRKSGDPNGTWIEVQNATGADVDLEGTAIRVQSVVGSTDMHLLVRRAVPVAAGDYVVLGAFDDAGRPDHVDYGFGADFDHDAPASGAITITACDVEIDRVVFDALPTDASWQLGDDGQWCAGSEAGTPGSGNPPCV